MYVWDARPAGQPAEFSVKAVYRLWHSGQCVYQSSRCCVMSPFWSIRPLQLAAAAARRATQKAAASCLRNPCVLIFCTICAK
jgi:hypothetical protein